MSKPSDRQADAKFAVTGKAPAWAVTAWDEPAEDSRREEPAAATQPSADEQDRPS